MTAVRESVSVFCFLYDCRMTGAVLISPPAVAPDLAARQRDKRRERRNKILRTWVLPSHPDMFVFAAWGWVGVGGGDPMLQKSRTQQQHPVSPCVSESADVAKTWTESLIKIKMLLSNN